MSRSIRKAIIKDRPRNYKKSSKYWRTVRSCIKNSIRNCKNLEELEIPDPKIIVNDYDYCDYIFDYEYKLLEEKYLKEKIKVRRK